MAPPVTSPKSSLSDPSLGFLFHKQWFAPPVDGQFHTYHPARGFYDSDKDMSVRWDHAGNFMRPSMFNIADSQACM
ncbi:hypothetical protein TWF696_009528 [Orbilia brochopaga]|uniref:Uncharacterized protein n=1 Tax=Orbilia brochopaga TaxID=3140254 RepID=A0AAV9UBK1_9PEZI